MIVDDEKIIRETISSIIDWCSMGIEIAGVCKDGIEAYDCIMDESPDIVMTDIKMPGLSGLELIQKVCEAKLSVEFVILSGYGEFEFAQTAMKYGVRHYLLKPCNEEEIINVIHSCITACQQKTAHCIDGLLASLFEDKNNYIRQQKYFTKLTSQPDTELIKTQLIKIMMEDARSESPHLTYIQMTEYMVTLNQCNNMEELTTKAQEIMTCVFHTNPEHKYNNCVEKVIEYITEHFADENLSLKWIAENYLYMNADYVSKQFARQTGCKFSSYLTNLRVSEAKELLLNKTATDSPYTVAEKVGFGNNPQYFSQIFKKYTNMTPSAYLKKMNQTV